MPLMGGDVGRVGNPGAEGLRLIDGEVFDKALRCIVNIDLLRGSIGEPIDSTDSYERMSSDKWYVPTVGISIMHTEVDTCAYTWK